MINGKYFTANHNGDLKETLNTEQCIQKFIADTLIKTGIYTFYCYDERIKAKRYILYKHHLNLGLPTWLHVYDHTKGRKK